MDTRIIQKVLGAGVILSVILGGYFLYTKAPSSSGSVSSDKTSSNEQTSQNIVSITEKLKMIALDTSFFTSQEFLSLKNLSSQPITEAVGRPNPFAEFNFPATSTTISRIKLLKTSR